LRKADRRNARFRQVSLLRGNVAMQVACTGGQVARIALAQSRAADRRIPRAAARQHADVACSDIWAIVGAPARVRLARIKRAVCPPWVRLAKTPRDRSSHNQGECDSALIVNNRKIYNDFSAGG
jgi:hypothetical protein